MIVPPFCAGCGLWLLVDAAGSIKRRICCFGGNTAAVETDRLQIVIYVADGSLIELRWGRSSGLGETGDQFFKGEEVAGLRRRRIRYGLVN